MKKIFLALAIASLPALLSAKEIKVEYKDIAYTIKHDKNKFVYEDKYIKKEYALKDCNRDQFDIFWSQYRSTQSGFSNKLKIKKDFIKLTEDNKQKKIHPNADFGNFLIKNVPSKTAAFDVHEKIKCTN